jgi:hypothetical protein
MCSGHFHVGDGLYEWQRRSTVVGLHPRAKEPLMPFVSCIEITRVANGIIVSENFLVAVQPQVVEHCKVTTGAGRMDQKHA